MRAFHSAEKNRIARHRHNILTQYGRRFISLLLCLCMIMSMMLNFSGLLSSAEPVDADYIMSRIADANTMDDYQNRLLNALNGSRYAGRVWTDKSVFAYDPKGMNKILLDMATDGYDGNVAYNADFAHVFSALASSQITHEAVTSPLDIVILLDMSGSMGSDIEYASEHEGQIPIKTLNGSRSETNNTMIVTPGHANWEPTWWDVYTATYSSACGGYVVTDVRRAGAADGRNISVPSNGILVAVHNPGVTAPDHSKVDVGDVLMPNSKITKNNSGVVTGVSSGAAFDIYKGHTDIDERIKHSRIYSVVESINKSIDILMEMNETNRVAVIGYGGTAAMILPLGHYTKSGTDNYISVGDFTDYNTTSYDKNKSGSAAYTVFGHAIKVTYNSDGSSSEKKEETAIRNDYHYDGKTGVKLIGFHTDLQAGIYLGFNELYNNLNSAADVTYSYSSSITGVNKTVQRVPAAFVMTDGGSNYALKNTTSTASTGNEWFNVPVRDSIENDYSGAWKKYRAETSGVKNGGDAVILDILLTASYMKSKIENKYTELLRKANILKADEKTDFEIHTISVDTPTTDWQIPRVYVALDPADYFKENPQVVAGKESIDPTKWEQLADAKSAYNYYQSWKSSADGVTISFKDSDSQNLNIKFNKLSGDANVTNTDVENNILYNDSFRDIGAGDLSDTFRELIDNFNVPVFTPIAGDNDADVGDAITYMDPIGEYMEIKNQAITTKLHHDSEAAETTYDMSLLLFGDMHGLERAGVYDYQWNDKYMTNHPDEGEHGVTPFPMGWYWGDDPVTAQKAEDMGIEVKNDDSGSYPAKNPKTNKEYANSEEAWEDGWVYRFNFSTVLLFVPIVNPPENGLPTGLSEQVMNTVYTCYRFAGSKTERNQLRRNPIFGTTIPSTLAAKWAEYAASGNYPDGNDDYKDIDGIYRLSDIRVWIEDTGDYIDTEGAITPNSGYDRALYINVPASAVPTQLATVTVSNETILSYQTNLGSDHGNAREYCIQSTPLRLFYAVGLEDRLILRDKNGNQTGVDFNSISAEYLNAHTIEGMNYVWFISNFYSNTRYGDYATDTTSRTRGDPTVTFSPSEQNRYYVFQKALPLYAHAYRLIGDELKPVDNADNAWRDADGKWANGYKNGAGNGGTTWETLKDQTAPQSAASWAGGEYMGTYSSFESFNEKLEAARTAGTIKDDHDTTYKFVEDGIVFLDTDMLENVTSKTGGTEYTEDSISFSSNDYFFILVEYYLPTEGIGTDPDGKPLEGTTNARKVQYAVARKGSEFGSGFSSNKIDNGDMLCWTDTSGHFDIEFRYMSYSETGDLTRGHPTWEKLTKTGTDLENYLYTTCGIDRDTQLPDPDADPESEEDAGKTVSVYDYWIKIQNKASVKAALKEAAGGTTDTPTKGQFDEYFRFSVATRTGGIRTGDMSNNVQMKGTYDAEKQTYSNNVTGTSNSYYLPTVSDNSGTDDKVIINNYLGNNGYLEVANQMIHVSKILEAPDGFMLTDSQLQEKFNYQIYIQGIAGERTAIQTLYNKYSKVWERRLAYIDVLTDNSSLVMDNNSNRALFDVTENGTRKTARLVVTNEDGNLVYADDDGNPTSEMCNKATTALYFLYLPSNGSDGDARNTRRLYKDPEYDGTADGFTDPNAYDKNGRTTFFAEGEGTETEETAGNRDSYRLESKTPDRPAGTRSYWAMDAELIPVNEVIEAEAVDEVLGGEPGGISVMALESTSGGMWTHDTAKCTEHTKLDYYTFVIRKPNDETSESNFSSPFLTRTLYMTTTLNFGVNSNENDGGLSAVGADLVEGDLYDKIIPSEDRPDLFKYVGTTDVLLTNKYIAEHTAEFTLKHGEGLLLTGLDNRVTYRFTEKLTQDQIERGYMLKKISHIQQVGSESTYLPGIQTVPVYTQEGATYGNKYPGAEDKKTENDLTWAINESGTTNPNAAMTNEPFAHTNAVMWEYYATMDANASGNHHQIPGTSEENKEKESQSTVWKEGEPNTYESVGTEHIVSDNPSCTIYDPETNTGCDVEIRDAENNLTGYLHYMYRNGELTDPHYEGEASTYLRNMSRYGVSPTVHFGVNGETQDSTKDLPSKLLDTALKNGYYDYDGVYSVYGNTGWFEEQANFFNTISPDMIVVTKQIVNNEGEIVETPPDKVFHFTLTLKPSTRTAMTAANDDRLYVWSGLIEDIGKDPKDGGAPALDDYQDYLDSLTMITPEEKEEGDTSGNKIYKIDLIAKHAVVVYGLIAGTDYEVTEEPVENFPAVDNKGEHKVTGPEHLVQSDTVKHNIVDYVAMKPADTTNRRDFYNQMSTGMITIEKVIMDDDAETVDKEFEFTVTLTPPEGIDLKPGDVAAVKYLKDNTIDTTFTSNWVNGNGTDEDSRSLIGTFVMHHGDRVAISGIPVDTKYKVAESDTGGYYLEHVSGNKDNTVGGDGKYLPLDRKDHSVSGTVTNESSEIYLVFNNAKPPVIPFTGSGRAPVIYVAGAALLLGFIASFVTAIVLRRRRLRVHVK